MAFGEVKIEFCWFPSMGLPWTREGELHFPQAPVAFNTPFFSRITIEKLIQTLKLCVYKSKKYYN